MKRMKRISGKWYHDFSKLGLDTSNNSGYQKNQEIKEEVITKMLNQVQILEPNPINVLDVFTSDGYYSFIVDMMYDKLIKNIISVDLDLESKYEKQYNLIKDELSVNSTFIKSDINKFISNNKDTFNMTICFGGLYHIHNPKEVIENLLKISNYLLIQTVVPSHITNEEYFTTPAPNWKHGCRFSVKTINNWIDEMNCEKIFEHYNELTNNRNMDNGSYYTILKSTYDL